MRIISLIAILIVRISYGQTPPTWRMFHAGDVAYYFPLAMQNSHESNENFAWYVSDSLVTHSYTRYFFHKNLMGNIDDFNSSCIADNNKGWAGIRANVTDTTVQFFNRNEMPIVFKTNTKVGDNWPVNNNSNMHYFFEHHRDTIEDVINGADSVRWYYLSSNQAGTIQRLDSFALSKHHGMFIMFNVWHFLTNSTDAIFRISDLDNYTKLKLASRKSIPGIIQNFKLWDCYPFEPGDEVQEMIVKNTFKFSALIEWDSAINIVKYTHRYTLGDSALILKRELRTFSRKLINGNYNEALTTSNDSIVLYNDTSFDLEPGFASESINMLSISEFENHTVKSTVTLLPLRGNPWCVSDQVSDGYRPRKYFIKGIGAYTFHESYRMSEIVTETYHYPFYYKRGNISWGTPYPFPLGTKEYVYIQSNIKLYPNPGSDRINFSEPVIGTIKVFDLNGKLLQKRINNQPESTLYLNLPAGSYLIEIVDSTGITTRTRWTCIK